LLNYYSPFKVAEVFHTLSTLFPGRIDLGLARGIGAAADAAALLRDGAATRSDADAVVFERKTRDLIAHLRSEYEAQRKQESSAAPPAMPEIWLLGSGTRSAELAATLGTSLAMTLWYQPPGTVDIQAILNRYAAQFRRAPDGSRGDGRHL